MVKYLVKGFLTLLMMVALVFGTTATASAKSYSGGRSIGGSYSSHSSGSTFGGTSSSSTYHSGYKSPSSNVSGYKSNNTYSAPRSTGGLGHFFGGLATGMMVSSLFHGMFHPFGGYGYGGYHGFSIFGFLIDLLVIWIIWRVVRGIFFRR